jgi:ATP-dependent DNA helicase DinG
MAVAGVDACLQALESLLGVAADRGPRLANCRKRCAGLGDQLRRFQIHDGADVVRWFETHTHGFNLCLTPLDIAPLFHERVVGRGGTLVFTSATLAVREDFSYFTRQLGLQSAGSHRFESPFDYTRQALLYLPEIAGGPRKPGYTSAVVTAAIPVLEASGGRAFLLFTSHRALREAYELLQSRVAYPLLAQGTAPRGELLDRFRNTPQAVLLGTSSFWEGVDVRGEALSCVIIDKLPFTPPDDPMTQARVAALKSRHGNPFREYQLPEAVIALKQGVGRLIRDVNDRGVLCLCDPRVRTRAYGRVFLQALPPLRVTRDIADVQAFFGNDSAQL